MSSIRGRGGVVWCSDEALTTGGALEEKEQVERDQKGLTRDDPG